jgi:hypothetical protein
MYTVCGYRTVNAPAAARSARRSSRLGLSTAWSGVAAFSPDLLPAAAAAAAVVEDLEEVSLRPATSALLVSAMPGAARPWPDLLLLLLLLRGLLSTFLLLERPLLSSSSELLGPAAFATRGSTTMVDRRP